MLDGVEGVLSFFPSHQVIFSLKAGSLLLAAAFLLLGNLGLLALEMARHGGCKPCSASFNVEWAGLGASRQIER